MIIKKVFSIVLAAAIFINTCGFVFIYWNLKKVYKHFMLSKIESAEVMEGLEEIIVSKDLIGTKTLLRIEEHEIKYMGKMYDIVNEYDEGNYTRFICINDEKEDFIDKVFVENIEGNTSEKQNKNPLNNIFKFSISLALLFEEDISSFESSANLFQELSYNLHTITPDIPTPPPQLL